jgi:soluble lytic murein transglycosylase-like protein
MRITGLIRQNSAFLFSLMAMTAVVMHAEPVQRQQYDGMIRSLAREHGVPSDLIHSIIEAESNYNHRAVSHKGAMGLMQLMPATARQYGVKDVFDARENITGGIRYLKDLMRLFNRNTKLVLAAYNSGQHAVEKYGGIPPYRETINYIQKIQRSYRRSTIGPSTEIYRYVDDRGRVVLTNNYFEYKSHTQKKSKK